MRMGDLWLLAWFGGGVVAAYGFAGAALLHARRSGRRWHEVVLAVQSVGIVACCTYVLVTLLVGPLWALIVTPNLMVALLLAVHLVNAYYESRAMRAVLARERGR
jgi:ABC-type transporter Mla maintaining outer membrane lipid asymmetry permease subunit MlaE